MIANTRFAAAHGRREAIACARSIKTKLARPILASLMGALCVVRVALAEPAPLKLGAFEGRWVSEGKKLTLDISRCGEDWCGVVVESNTCGRTALRVNDRSLDQSSPQSSGNPELFGKLQLAANTEPYGVIVTLSRAKNWIARAVRRGSQRRRVLGVSADLRLQGIARARR